MINMIDSDSDSDSDSDYDNDNDNDKSKTGEKVADVYAEPAKRRQFFDDFARKLNINPLIPDHWYEMLPRDVYRVGGQQILYYYGKSLPSALMDVYPDIGLDKDKFVQKAAPTNQPTNHQYY